MAFITEIVRNPPAQLAEFSEADKQKIANAIRPLLEKYVEDCYQAASSQQRQIAAMMPLDCGIKYQALFYGSIVLLLSGLLAFQLIDFTVFTATSLSLCALHIYCSHRAEKKFVVIEERSSGGLNNRLAHIARDLLPPLNLVATYKDMKMAVSLQRACTGSLVNLLENAVLETDPKYITVKKSTPITLTLVYAALFTLLTSLALAGVISIPLMILGNLVYLPLGLIHSAQFNAQHKNLDPHRSFTLEEAAQFRGYLRRKLL